MNVPPYAHDLVLRIMEDVKFEGAPRIEVPHLIRTNSMKSREVSGLKEIKDPRTHVSGATKTAPECADGDGV
jgi:hypothetical protein